MGIPGLSVTIFGEVQGGWGSSVGERHMNENWAFVTIVGSEMEEVVGSSHNLGVDWVNSKWGGVGAQFGIDVIGVVLDKVLVVLVNDSDW